MYFDIRDQICLNIEIFTAFQKPNNILIRIWKYFRVKWYSYSVNIFKPDIFVFRWHFKTVIVIIFCLNQVALCHPDSKICPTMLSVKVIRAQYVTFIVFFSNFSMASIFVFGLTRVILVFVFVFGKKWQSEYHWHLYSV